MKNKENFIGFREDTEDFFKWSTGVSSTKAQFSPYIIILEGKVYIEWYWGNLITGKYPLKNSDIIMQVWPGHWRCDCFIFTLRELKDYLKINKIVP